MFSRKRDIDQRWCRNKVVRYWWWPWGTVLASEGADPGSTTITSVPKSLLQLLVYFE